MSAPAPTTMQEWMRDQQKRSDLAERRGNPFPKIAALDGGSAFLRKNLVRNGEFRISQRYAVSGKTFLPGEYGFDGWCASGVVNIIRNPRAVYPGGVNTDWSTGSGGPTTSNTNFATGGPNADCPSFFRVTTTNNAAGYVLVQNGSTSSNVLPIEPGRSYDLSVWVRASVAQTVYIDFQAYNSAGTTIMDSPDNPTTALPANTWVRISLLGIIAPSAGVRAMIRAVFGGAATTGATYDVTGFRLSLSTKGDRTTYFDGAMSGRSWAGAVHLSPSYSVPSLPTISYADHLNGYYMNLAYNPSAETDATTYMSVLNAALSRSTAWAAPGGGSASFQMVCSGTDSFLQVGGIYFVPGRTYTISAYARLAAPLSGTQDSSTPNRARRIWVYDGGSATVLAVSSVLPNVAGSARLSVTVTIPTTMNPGNLILRLYAGHSAGTMWWDNILVTEGDQLVDYFDGGTPGASWDGWNNGALGRSFFPAQSNPLPPRSRTITLSAGSRIMQPIERQDVVWGSNVLSWGGTATGRVYSASLADAARPAFAPSPIVVDLDGSDDLIVEFYAAAQATLSSVTLTPGTVAHLTRRTPIAEELLRCQRYFYGLNFQPWIPDNVPIGLGQCWTGSGTFMPLKMATTMRVAPVPIFVGSPGYIRAHQRGVAIGTASAAGGYGANQYPPLSTPDAVEWYLAHVTTGFVNAGATNVQNVIGGYCGLWHDAEMRVNAF